MLAGQWRKENSESLTVAVPWNWAASSSMLHSDPVVAPATHVAAIIVIIIIRHQRGNLLLLERIHPCCRPAGLRFAADLMAAVQCTAPNLTSRLTFRRAKRSAPRDLSSRSRRARSRRWTRPRERATWLLRCAAGGIGCTSLWKEEEVGGKKTKLHQFFKNKKIIFFFVFFFFFFFTWGILLFVQEPIVRKTLSTSWERVASLRGCAANREERLTVAPRSFSFCFFSVFFSSFSL